MAFSAQIRKIKENWLLIILVLLAAGLMGYGTKITPFAGMSQVAYSERAFAAQEMADEGFGVVKSAYLPYGPGFAPDVEDRIVTKTAYMSTEVEKGKFRQAEANLMAIVKSSESILLNQNVNSNEVGRKKYYSGTYYIKVQSEKYAAVVNQLEKVGEVRSFSESQDDITAQYTNAELELEVEKERLARYRQMYEEAEDVSDKLELSDRIFSQERTVKYLEDRIANMDQRVDYSSMTVTITEKRSEYFDVALVRFSELVKALVQSFNSLLYLLFIAFPYAVVALLAWASYVLFGRKKGK